MFFCSISYFMFIKCLTDLVCCHVLLTRHGAWFDNWICWTHITCNSSQSQSQSQSYIATDGWSISKSWCRGPSGAHDQIFIVWQLRSYFCGAPSLTRGRVCLLYMLLALTSAVFLGSESLGSHNHILLSQFWDFPFRHLLWLAGSWWRYSTPPPHGSDL
jgi:hypothetical protein